MYSAVAAERRGGAAPLVAREGQAPNGAGRIPVGEPEPAELIVWHEFLDQRKELSLLEPDVCVKQLSRRSQRLSIDAAGGHSDFEFASEPLELYVFDACLAEESRLRRNVPEEKREEVFFLIAKVDTRFVPEELPAGASAVSHFPQSATGWAGAECRLWRGLVTGTVRTSARTVARVARVRELTARRTVRRRSPIRVLDWGSGLLADGMTALTRARPGTGDTPCRVGRWRRAPYPG